MTTPIIGYAGMTHLGINSAVAAADRGFQVVCYDPDPKRIDGLKRRELPVVEKDLPELLEKNYGRFRFTADAHDLASCDVVYIAQDVPTDDFGISDLSRIDMLIRQVDVTMRSDAAMIILSQVPPGFTRGRTSSGRLMYYQVETLIFGRAMERARFPERFIVGCAEPRQPLMPAFARFLESFDCPILPMRYESAELAKISINMCLVASVGVANTMAELCEQVDADWSEIVPALKLDRRIGQYSYLAPGLGIAGGNLERDLATVISLSKQYGTDSGIVSAWVDNSRHRKDWAWRTLSKRVLAQNPGAKIAVLGLAYKEDTHSTKNSPSLQLLTHLRDYSVVVYDPVVTARDSGFSFKATLSAMEAVQGVDVVCIMTPWGEFKKLAPSDLVKAMHGRWLLDPFKVVDGKAARSAGLQYVTLGVAPEEN